MDIERSAAFSSDRMYRYTLWRRWGPSDGYVMFIGLNPSTADEFEDDPTIRRCIGFSKAWGYDAMVMTNLFAFRATQPADMMKVAHPVGEGNNSFLIALARAAEKVIAAWGTGGDYLGRGDFVRGRVPGLHYLRLTKDGHPGHPLYLPKTCVPTPWHLNKQ